MAAKAERRPASRTPRVVDSVEHDLHLRITGRDPRAAAEPSKLVLQFGEPSAAAEALETLWQVRPRLNSLGFSTSLLSRPELLELARACGVAELTVQLANGRTKGPLDADPKRVAIESDGLVEVSLDGTIEVALLPSIQSAGEFQRATLEMVNDMRLFAARSRNPLFARSTFDFVDGTPRSHEEAIAGDTLARRLGHQPCVELFELFTTLALNLDDVQRGDLRPASIAVYWLGSLVFQTLSGRVPYPETESANAIALCLVNGSTVKLSDVMPVPEGLSALVSSMLALEPAHRPSALFVAARLQQFQAGLPRDGTFSNSQADSAVRLSLTPSARHRPVPLT